MTDNYKALASLVIVVAGLALTSAEQWAGGIFLILWAAWIVSGLEPRGAK